MENENCYEIVETGIKEYFAKDKTYVLDKKDLETYVEHYVKSNFHEHMDHVPQTICLIKYLELQEQETLIDKIRTQTQRQIQLFHSPPSKEVIEGWKISDKELKQYYEFTSGVDPYLISQSIKGTPLHEIFRNLMHIFYPNEILPSYIYESNKAEYDIYDIEQKINNNKEVINERDENGNTPLMLACEKDIFGTFIIHLLSSGANMFLKNKKGQNSLIIAAYHNNYIYLFVMSYIAQKCNTNNVIPYDITEFIKKFKELLQKNDENKLKKYMTSMGEIQITEKKLIQIIDILQSKIEKDNYEHICSMNEELYSAHTNLIDEADNDGNTALIITSSYPYSFFSSEILIDIGCDINLTNLKGNTALMIACENGNGHLIEKLRDQLGIDVGVKNTEGKNAYSMCVNLSDKQKLLKNTEHSILFIASPNLKNGTPENGFLILESAIKYGKTDLFKSIFSNYGIDIFNTRDKKGNNVLMLACKHGNEGLVKMVIEHIDTTFLNKKAWNARKKQEFFFRSNIEDKCCLHLATESGKLDLVKYLLDLECFKKENLQKTDQTTTIDTFAQAFSGDARFTDVDGPAIFANVKFNPSRIASLHLAAELGYFEIAKCLIEHGCDVVVKKIPRDINPIHDAAKNGHAKIVDMLLQNEANSTYTVGGKTSLQMAQSEIKKLELILTEFVSENDQTQKIKKQIEKLKEVECILELCKYIIEGNAADFEKKFREKSNTKVEPQVSTEQIVKYDLDPNTFWRVACFNYKKDIMDLLLSTDFKKDFKIDPYHKDLLGMTIMKWAQTKTESQASKEFGESNNKSFVNYLVGISNKTGGSLNKTRKLFKKKTRKNKKPKRFQRKSRKSFRKH